MCAVSVFTPIFSELVNATNSFLNPRCGFINRDVNSLIPYYLQPVFRTVSCVIKFQLSRSVSNFQDDLISVLNGRTDVWYDFSKKRSWRIRLIARGERRKSVVAIEIWHKNNRILMIGDDTIQTRDFLETITNVFKDVNIVDEQKTMTTMTCNLGTVININKSLYDKINWLPDAPDDPKVFYVNQPKGTFKKMFDDDRLIFKYAKFNIIIYKTGIVVIKLTENDEFDEFKDVIQKFIRVLIQ